LANNIRQPVRNQNAGGAGTKGVSVAGRTQQDLDRTFLRKAICWAEILEKPVCRRRREKNCQSK